MTITALPTPPSRTDPANFAARGDAFLGALPTFATEVNAEASAINANASAAAASATAAAASQSAAASSAAAASASANSAASASGASAWVSGTTYALGAVVYSTVSGRTYRRIVAGAGTTDPSADATNWRVLVLDMDTGYPTARPSLLLDFANSKQLDPRITFTRATSATFYDGSTVAKAEENLLLYSQAFDNAAWTKTAATVTANSTTAPDGTTTAETLEGDGTSAVHRCFQSLTPISGNAYVFSVYAKANTNNYLQLLIPFTVNHYANFDLSLGVLGAVGSAVTAAIASVGSGWYRCSIVLTATSSAANNAIICLINAASAAYYPTITLSTSVYLWGAQLEQRSSVTAYTPTTTQPITNYTPVLQTAAAGVPRFDHDPVTRESRGLLIEEQRTNLLTYSEQFDNAAWTKTQLTVTANATVAPDGTLTADKVASNTNSAFHELWNPFTSVLSTTYTQSFFVKAGEHRFVQLLGPEAVFAEYANFDLLTGDRTAGTSGFGQIQSVGNGWYRISMTATALSASATARIAIALVASGTSARAQTYAGDGWSGIYIWGAQLEAGAFATSYIPTVASQVTRNADVASITGANFSSWYRADEGTLFVDQTFDVYRPLTAIPTLYKAGAENGNHISIYNSTTTSFTGTTRANTGAPAFVSKAATVVGTHRMAIAYKENDSAFTLDGLSAGALSNPSPVPSVDSLGVAGLLVPYTQSGQGVAHLRRISYWPRRLTNAQLQAITTQ